MVGLFCFLDKGFPSSENFKESTFSTTFSLLNEYFQAFHLHEGLDPNVPLKSIQSFVLTFANDEKNFAELLSSPPSTASISMSLGSSSKWNDTCKPLISNIRPSKSSICLHTEFKYFYTIGDISSTLAPKTKKIVTAGCHSLSYIQKTNKEWTSRFIFTKRTSIPPQMQQETYPLFPQTISMHLCVSPAYLSKILLAMVNTHVNL